MDDRPRVRVAIVVPNHRGHRLNYVRILSDHANDLGTTPLVIGGHEAASSSEADLYLAGCTVRWETVDRVTWASVLEVAQNNACGHVVLPDGDRFLLQILRRRTPPGISLTVLLLRSPKVSLSGLRSMCTALAKRLAVAVVRRRSTTKVLSLRGATASTVKPSYEVRDPVTFSVDQSRIAWLRDQGLDPATTWYAVVGSVTPRKNLDVVLEALSIVGRDGRGLIVAGKVDDLYMNEVGPALEAAERDGLRVLLIDRLLDEAELDAVISSVDCVVLAHSNEGPSGVFGKAAAAGTTVLAAGALSLKEDCKEAPASTMWTPLSAVRIAEGIQRLERRPPATSRPSVSGAAEFASTLLARGKTSP
jgi:glycosyltransferase involved in cell wall biosynthesis